MQDVERRKEHGDMTISYWKHVAEAGRRGEEFLELRPGKFRSGYSSRGVFRDILGLWEF
jgi:hypothetical protein